MEWERAKNYILIFFVLLNLGLAFLWFSEYNRHTMTDEQERIIRTILSQNNISMYTHPMRRSPPMRHLDVSGFYYDIDELVGIFFDNPAETEHSYGINRHEIISEYSRLTISNGWISYVNSSPGGFRNTGEATINFTESEEITGSIATKIAEDFILSYFPDFRQDSNFYMRDASGQITGVKIMYRQLYRDRIIHSNFVEILVTEEGIRQMEMQFGRVLGHGGTYQMIFSPDEALLTFVQRVRPFAQEEPWIITYMDIAYFHEYDVSDLPGVIYPAVPFYRVFIQGTDLPFLINAYTNVLID